MKCPSSSQGLVITLAFFSGMLALAQQLLWTRRMVDLLGAAAGSTARVFACFFLGLALGSMVAGRLSARVRKPWRAAGLAELAVALLSLPMLTLNHWAERIWPWLGPENLTGPAGTLLKTALSILLVLPPAFTMGFFLPMAGAILHSRRRPGQDPGLTLYVSNTLGALAGILFGVFILPALTGIFQAMQWVIFGNVLTASVYLILDRASAPLHPASAAAVPASRSEPPPSRTTLLAVSGLSGFLVLALEITALLLVQWIAPLSFFAPGSILFAFIGILALCGLAISTVPLSSAFRRNGLQWTALLAGIALLTCPLLFHAFAPHFPVETPAAHLPGFFFRIVLFTLLVFGPAVFTAGLWFPLAAKLGADDPARATGERWGQLLAVNGIGGWLGAELSYRLLLPAFGPFGTLGLLGSAYLFAANLLLRPGQSKWNQAGSPMLFLTGAYLSLQIFPSLPSTHPGFQPHVLKESHGREGSFVILDHPVLGRAILMYNQYILGSSAAAALQERQAHIPLLLHPNPARVGFLGAGTGISPGAALAHDSVQTLETAEISRTVALAAHRWFATENRNWLTDPRSTVLIEDARTWVAASPGRFDVLVSDLFLPWGPGEGRLFTVEHFTACLAALAPGGLFCMWIPLYQLTEDQVLLILNSFLTVFGPTTLFLREPSDSSPALALIGWNQSSLDWSSTAKRLGQSGLKDPVLSSLEALQSLYLGTFPAPIRSLQPLNTLDNLRLELDAARIQRIHAADAPYLHGETFQLWRHFFSDFLERSH